MLTENISPFFKNISFHWYPTPLNLGHKPESEETLHYKLPLLCNCPAKGTIVF